MFIFINLPGEDLRSPQFFPFQGSEPGSSSFEAEMDQLRDLPSGEPIHIRGQTI